MTLSLGIKNRRQPLECGGLTPLSNSMIDQGIGKRRSARRTPKLRGAHAKLNAIAFLRPLHVVMGNTLKE